MKSSIEVLEVFNQNYLVLFRFIIFLVGRWVGGHLVGCIKILTHPQLNYIKLKLIEPVLHISTFMGGLVGGDKAIPASIELNLN